MTPQVHSQTRVQVHKARVRTAPGLPNPNHVRSGRPTSPEGTTQRSVGTDSPGVVSVHVAETRGRAIQRRAEQVGGAVEVQDGVAAGDVEWERAVELETLVDEIGGDAGGVGDQGGGLDHEALGGGVDGCDWIRVVEGVEHQRAAASRRVAADFVGLVAAGGARAEWVWDCGVAAVGALFGGGCAPGVY